MGIEDAATGDIDAGCYGDEQNSYGQQAVYQFDSMTEAHAWYDEVTADDPSEADCS